MLELNNHGRTDTPTNLYLSAFSESARLLLQDTGAVGHSLPGLRSYITSRHRSSDSVAIKRMGDAFISAERQGKGGCKVFSGSTLYFPSGFHTKPGFRKFMVCLAVHPSSSEGSSCWFSLAPCLSGLLMPDER